MIHIYMHIYAYICVYSAFTLKNLQDVTNAYELLQKNASAERNRLEKEIQNEKVISDRLSVEIGVRQKHELTFLS